MISVQLKCVNILTFLIAPVQRIPRYKLLVEAVLKLLPEIDKNETVIQQGKKLLELLENVRFLCYGLKERNELSLTAFTVVPGLRIKKRKIY